MSTFNGKITEISEIKTGIKNDKEWASLEFEVTELNPQNELYPQIGSFGYFKNGDYAKYTKDFNNMFKLGDEVTVEFNLKRIDYKKDGQDRKFYKTECWKVEKLQTAPQTNQAPAQAFEPVADLNADDSDVPF